MDYIKSTIDKDLDLRNKAFNAIQIVGPKGCMETRTEKKDAKQKLYFEQSKV